MNKAVAAEAYERLGESRSFFETSDPSLPWTSHSKVTPPCRAGTEPAAAEATGKPNGAAAEAEAGIGIGIGKDRGVTFITAKRGDGTDATGVIAIAARSGTGDVAGTTIHAGVAEAGVLRRLDSKFSCRRLATNCAKSCSYPPLRQWETLGGGFLTARLLAGSLSTRASCFTTQRRNGFSLP
jgi:hypothetical protein